MNEYSGNNRELLTKWLQVLFYTHIVSIAAAIISSLLDMDAAGNWISRIITVVGIVALFQIIPVNDRYRKAAIFYAVGLVAGLLADSVIFSLIGAVCSLVATYQEYHGHSETVEGMDPQLARKWENLFIWSIMVEVLTVLMAVVALVLAAFGEVGGFLASAVALIVLLIGTVIYELLYLKYLKRMLGLFKESEEIIYG